MLTLDEMNIPYTVIVEYQEYHEYLKFIPHSKLLILPPNIDPTCGGGIPARNFVLDYSISKGELKHWILDDNIKGFFRYHLNCQLPVKSGVCFRVIEDYVDRYTNILLSGMNYYGMIPSISQGRKLCNMNTRIYSCILIDNKINQLGFRWRGTYNEDY